jgi:hypothetical protein
MSPRRFHLALLAAAVACLSTPAMATETSGWVYNGLTGIARLKADDLSDQRFASSSNIGYRWGVFGVEVGHVDAFGRFRDNFGSGSSRFDVDAKLKGWSAGINLNHDIDANWSLQGRVGAFNWDADSGIEDSLGNRVEGSDSGTDWYAGASIDYNWRKRSSIGFGYTHYRANDADMDLFGLHSEFRF